MKISIKSKDNQVTLLNDLEVIEMYKKDEPINFKKFLDLLVDLKFSQKIELEIEETNDIQNKALIRLVQEIVESYNKKFETFEKIKTSHLSSNTD